MKTINGRKTTHKLAALLFAAVLLFSLTACDDDNRRYQDPPEATAPSESDTHHSESTAAGGGGTSGDIGMEQARAIALARVPGATAANVVEMEQEYDDGRLEYEGTIYYNGYEYEFEIDGTTGTILKWEIDD